jgi:hypothetical protein
MEHGVKKRSYKEDFIFRSRYVDTATCHVNPPKLGAEHLS